MFSVFASVSYHGTSGLTAVSILFSRNDLNASSPFALACNRSSRIDSGAADPVETERQTILKRSMQEKGLTQLFPISKSVCTSFSSL